MSNNKKKQKTTAGYVKPVMTQEENDLMMNRLMLGFVIAVCAVTLVMMLKNNFNTIQLYNTVGPVMSVVCFVLFAVAVVFTVLKIKRGSDDSKKILTRWNLAVTGLLALFSGVLFTINPTIAIAYSVAMFIGACVLYFVWYIYPRAFFAAACMCLIEGFAIHAGFAVGTVGAFSGFLQLASKLGALILPIAAIVLFILAAKKFPRAFNGVALWQILVICAAALIGAALLFCGSLGLFYLAYHYVLYVMAAVLAVVGIVYTVKSI